MTINKTNLQGIHRTIFLVLTLLQGCLVVYSQSATQSVAPAPTPSTTPSLASTGLNVPKGFMDIEFGTKIDDAGKILAARNYRFQKRQDWQQIVLKNVPIAGLSAYEVILTFNGELGFYKGQARIKITCAKSKIQGTEAFDKISRTINSKYRRIPKVQEKLSKNKRNYWTTKWDFKTRDNKSTAYEIKLHLQDESNFKDGKWQKVSNIFIEYFAAWGAPTGPVPPKPPSEGL